MMTFPPKFSLSCFFAASLIMACSNHHEHSHSGDHHDDTHSADHDVSHKTQKHDVAPPNSDVSSDVDDHADEAEHDHERRSADAHTHGDAEVAIVLDGNEVTIELDSPLYNILGFENAPETEAQTATVEQAELRLEQSETLYTFNAAANCDAVLNDSHVTLFDDHDEDHHEDDDHEEKNHDDDHDEGTHKDVLLTYEFSCQNPAKLKNVTINLFEFFPELSEVSATYLGPATQKQLVLTRKQRQMDITP
ncbi:MAG: DUF2796 domain-containing protein [Maricaulaceae bacterium]